MNESKNAPWPASRLPVSEAEWAARPSKVTPDKLDLTRKRLATGETGATVAESIGVSRATLYRHLEKAT